MKKFYAICNLLFITLLHAQNPAQIDLTFQHKDEFPLRDLAAAQTLIQPDGKIVAIGRFGTYYKYDLQRNLCSGIVRFNSDLSVDETFNSGVGFNEFSFMGTVIRQQPDGKLLVGGTFTSYNNIPAKQLVRLNTDGSYDDTFTPSFANQPENGWVTSIGLLDDGKILVGGDINPDHRVLLRLNSDGSLDPTFSLPAAYNQSFVKTINILPNGKILLGQQFSNPNNVNTSDYKLVLFNSDGTLDTSFNMAPVSNAEIKNVIIQPDNKILVGFQPGQSLDFFIKRFNTDGSEDNSLDTGTGFKMTGYGAILGNLILMPNGDIVVFGNFDDYNNNTVNGRIRINTNGIFDTTFNYLASNSQDRGINAILLPDGNFLSDNYLYYAEDFAIRNAYMRLDANGYPVENQQPITRTFVTKLVKITGNQILALGTSKFPSVQYHNGIKLLDINGNLVYNQHLKALNNTVPGLEDAVVQPDGKVLFIGTMPQNPTGALMRFNADFSTDTSFNLDPVLAASSRFTCVRLQTNGKILVGSTSTTAGNESRIVRLNSDGTIDNSFSFGQGQSPALASEIKVMEIQEDGKILVGGNFTLIRLNTDGSFDSSFSTNKQGITTITIQPDSKILLGVYTTSGLTDNGIYRLNPDGSNDTAFSHSSGVINTIALQADGKILAGGRLSNNGAYGIMRLNSNGTIDPLFDAGIGFGSNNTSFESNVNSILVEPDGKILVGGTFTKYNGTFCNGVVRLLGGDAFLLSGRTKLDLNGNGCDIGDLFFPNVKFQINSTGGQTNEYIANTTGNYAIGLPIGTHTITPILENPSLFNVSPANFTVSFPSLPTTVNQNFCIAINGIHPDLEIYVLTVNTGRPGFDAKYKIIYKNKGNQIQSGTIGFNFDDSSVDFVNANPAVATQTSGNLTWNFSNLFPLQSREIIVTLNLNAPTETPGLNSGSVLEYTATVTSPLTDETPADNTFILHQTLFNSYDPNDKTCLQGSSVGTEKIGDYVHYLIRFENKGTYNAQHISVRDVIDTSKFDINTLTPISGSSLYVTRITENNKVEFYFQDINLPFDDANNDGYVAFKIKTKSTLVSGDSFSNTAAIYFDYNSAVNTNTATTIIQALAVQDFAFNTYYTVYPNPAHDLLNIEPKENIKITSLSIFNALGQLAIEIPNAQNTSTIDVSGLKAGNYFLRIDSDKGTSNTKFIKL